VVSRDPKSNKKISGDALYFGRTPGDVGMGADLPPGTHPTIAVRIDGGFSFPTAVPTSLPLVP